MLEVREGCGEPSEDKAEESERELDRVDQGSICHPCEGAGPFAGPSTPLPGPLCLLFCTSSHTALFVNPSWRQRLQGPFLCLGYQTVLFVLGITHTQFLYFIHSDHFLFAVRSQLAPTSPPTDSSYSGLQPPMPHAEHGRAFIKTGDLI